MWSRVTKLFISQAHKNLSTLDPDSDVAEATCYRLTNQHETEAVQFLKTKPLATRLRVLFLLISIFGCKSPAFRRSF